MLSSDVATADNYQTFTKIKNNTTAIKSTVEEASKGPIIRLANKLFTIVAIPAFNEEIPVLIAPILKGDADLVNGSRFLIKNGNHVPAFRRFGQKVLTVVTNAGSQMNIMDTQNSFRAFSKKTFNIVGNIPVFYVFISITCFILVAISGFQGLVLGAIQGITNLSGQNS